jgi:hypothetical protein
MFGLTLRRYYAPLFPINRDPGGVCKKNIFFNVSSIGKNLQPLVFVRNVTGAAGDSWTVNAQFPFLLLYGLVLDANGFYKPDTAAHNQAQKNAFTILQDQFYNASANYVNGGAFTDAAILYTPFTYSPDFGNYIYSEVGLPYDNTNPRATRYKNLASLVWNYWNDFDLTSTLPLNQLLDNLINKALAQADPRLFVSPGTYTLYKTNPGYTALEAWHTANGNFTGFMALEIQSIA